ncbi:Six-hairpin glycosidase-like protein [Aspergillus aurantiobrunneus]
MDAIVELFSENILAKVLRVATEALENNAPPTVYPEFVPQQGPNPGHYTLRTSSFWTCGFFPGILYLLRERAVKDPHVFPYLNHENTPIPLSTPLHETLTSLSQTWTAPLKPMATRTDTHDLGFILQPSLQKDWELTGDTSSLNALLTGARSLASRYVPSVRAIRSWDALVQADVSITSPEDDCLVIVDSMMNLDLLYYAARHLKDPGLADVATAHAWTVTSALLRTESPIPHVEGAYTGPLYSTYHVVNFDPHTGDVKEHRTAQGYNTESTWARGQAWAIMGFAQTYTWTNEREFLAVACGLAEYFLQRLESAPGCVERRVSGPGGRTIGRYVPLWDFDAPIEDEESPLRDSSAGVIAANGMLLLSGALEGVGEGVLAGRYRDAAMGIVGDTVEYSLSREKARFAAGKETGVRVEDVVAGQRFDGILKNATANHNAKDHDRYSDHGLVYADYYLLEFGNQLLRMGLV